MCFHRLLSCLVGQLIAWWATLTQFSWQLHPKQGNRILEDDRGSSSWCLNLLGIANEPVWQPLQYLHFKQKQTKSFGYVVASGCSGGVLSLCSTTRVAASSRDTGACSSVRRFRLNDALVQKSCGREFADVVIMARVGDCYNHYLAKK